MVDVLHPGRPNVPHSEIQKELAEKYRAKPNCVFTFGMKCSFGGGKSTGFGLIYDNEAKAMASEPQWRLVRVRAAPSPRRRSARISRSRTPAPAPAAVEPALSPCPCDSYSRGAACAEWYDGADGRGCEVEEGEEEPDEEVEGYRQGGG